jgi:ABC exporter DevB family membrane fusion protein
MKSQLFVKPIGWITVASIVTAAVAAGATTTYSILRYRSKTQTLAPVFSVSQKSVQKVAALGYLEPQGEVIQLSSPAFAEGARVEQLLVKRGDRVKAGQVIAILDSRDRLRAALQQAQTQVRVAQARLEQVKAGAKKGDINAQEARFQRIKAELEGQISTQRAIIASLEAQLQGEKIAQQATIERIKAELRNAQTDCGRYQALYQEGAVSAQQRDNFCLQEETTRERLKEAQATLNRIITTRQEQIKEAKANLNRTVATVQRQIEEAQATLESVAEVRSVDVQLATAELETARAAVQRAQAELDLAYVRSPRDGQIFKIHTWPGEINSNEGIVQIGQTEQMYVTAEVYETDISKVRIGQPVTITSDGVTEDLQGTIDEIGLQIGTKDVLGTDPVADADARVVEVKIRLRPEDSQRVAGLTNLQVNVLIDASASQLSATN